MADSSNESYHGPSKIGSAITGGVTGLAVATGGLMAKNKTLNVKFGALGMAVQGVVAALGAMVGYGRASSGQTQFDAMRDDNGQLGEHVVALQTQIQGLNQEVATARKSFAELHAKATEHAASHAAAHAPQAITPAGGHAASLASHAGASHAEAHAHASHAEHGSHAGALEASKEHAASGAALG